jgi:hypothetical protein
LDDERVAEAEEGTIEDRLGRIGSAGRRGDVGSTHGERFTEVVPPALSTDLDGVARGRSTSTAEQVHLAEVGNESPTLGKAAAEGEQHTHEIVSGTEWARLAEWGGVMMRHSPQLGLSVADLRGRATTVAYRIDGSLARQSIAHDAVVVGGSPSGHGRQD